MKKLVYILISGGLIALIGVVGFFAPGFVSEIQDKKADGSAEVVELEKIVLNYGTEPDMVHKLKLFRDNTMIFSFVLEATEQNFQEVVKTAGVFFDAVLARSNSEEYCFAEPIGILFENGETVGVWDVHFGDGIQYTGEVIVDDQSGCVLYFYLHDISYANEMREDVIFEAETGVAEVSVFAEMLIESYGIPNCEYRDGWLFVPESETETLRLMLVGDEQGIEFNAPN